MKLISTFFSVTVLIFLSNFKSVAQASIPKGKAQLIEFSNTNSSFTVPQGKTWVVYSIFSDYVTGGVMKYDSNNNPLYLDKPDEIKIFVKTLNGQEKTNIDKNIYGIVVFESKDASATNFPIIFPENTNISFVITQGFVIGKYKEYNGKAYISLVEMEN